MEEIWPDSKAIANHLKQIGRDNPPFLSPPSSVITERTLPTPELTAEATALINAAARPKTPSPERERVIVFNSGHGT